MKKIADKITNRIAVLDSLTEGLDILTHLGRVVSWDDTADRIDLAQLATMAPDPEMWLVAHLLDAPKPFEFTIGILQNHKENLKVLDLSDRMIYYFGADGEIEGQNTFENSEPLLEMKGIQH